MVYTNNTNRDIHMSKNLLKEAEETIYGPREDTYGPPNVNLTRIADQWSLYMKQKYDVDVKLDAEDVCWMMMEQVASALLLQRQFWNGIRMAIT